VSEKITKFLGHFPRIREGKKSETIFLKFRPFSLFVQNRLRFGRIIVRPLHFLFGPFLLMQPSNRPVGNTDSDYYAYPISGIEEEPAFGQVLALNNHLNVTRTRVTYYTTQREG